MEFDIAEGKRAEVSDGDFIVIKCGRVETPPYIMVVGMATMHYRGMECSHVLVRSKSPSYRLLEPGKSGKALVRIDYSIILGHKIRELYSGKEDILAYCEQREWAEHMRWIERLKEPIKKLPKITKVCFIG